MFNVSIKEYMGKLEGGILAMLSIVIDNDVYDATFWYTDKDKIVTISEKMKVKIGCDIEGHQDYPALVTKLSKLVVPYTELYNRIDNVNFDVYIPEDIDDEAEYYEQEDVEEEQEEMDEETRLALLKGKLDDPELL